MFCSIGTPIFAQVITTIAGTSTLFPTPVQAKLAPLGQIGSVAVDKNGNVYAPDSGNNVVVRISPDGTLTVVAGNGIPDFSGDGGPATSASLFFPVGVAIDSSGNLYIADSYNNKVRKVTANGIISTLAGNGRIGSSGDNGPAPSAELSYPCAVAADSSGNVYIADQANHRIRKVTPNGTITTFAGNGTNGALGDGGPATAAALDAPAGVAADLNGNVYIADEKFNRIRRVDKNGIITTFAGNGSQGFSGDGAATSVPLNGPAGVAVDSSGNVVIADTGNRRIRVVSNGQITTVAGNGGNGFSGDGPSLTQSLGGAADFYSATIFGPMGVAVDTAGAIYVADTLNLIVRKITGSGSNARITTIGGSGNYDSRGDGGPALAAGIATPLGLAIDGAGNLYIADGYRVRLVSPSGAISTYAGTGLVAYSGDGGQAINAGMNPVGIALDAAGNLFIADQINNRIRMVAANSHVVTTVAGNGVGNFSGDFGPAVNASIWKPTGVAIDASGNLYIADLNNNRIRKVSNSVITTIAGNGAFPFSGDGPATSVSLYSPSSVAVDASGNVYVADEADHRIRVVTNGVLTTIAGNGKVIPSRKRRWRAWHRGDTL